MKKVMFLIYSALFFAGCSSVQSVYLPAWSEQISFFESTAGYYPGGSLMKCRLSDTAYLNGYKCVSWVWFFEHGGLRQFQTAGDVNPGNFIIPSNSTIFFNEQSPGKIKYIWFSKDVTINNIECQGGGKISTEFYDNGNMKSCFLARDQNIQGFPCRRSLFNPLYFHPDGKIKILVLAADSSIQGTFYKRGESVTVGEDGRVSKFVR